VPDKDVAKVQVGTMPTRFAVVESGAIHTTVLTPPTNLLAKKKRFVTSPW